ncbi:MAG: MlaD family protein [Proteobacteria bacterium]|nr:MlaD family protein [Pseudomonadota bacterium]
MKKLTTEFRVGIFTILSIAALSYILFLLNSKYFSSKKTISHYTLTNNAKGVVNMTNVRAGGVTVGQVTGIKLKGQMTQIYFAIDSSILIPEGSKMELRTRGLLGETFLEVVRAPDSGRYIAEGDLVPMNTQFVDFSDLIRIIGSIAVDVKHVTESFSNLVKKDSHGKSRIETVFDGVEQSTTDLRRIIQSNEAQVKKILSNIKTTSDHLVAYTQQDPLKNLKEASAKIDDFITDAKGAVTGLQDIVSGMQQGKGTVGKLLTDEDLAEDLRETAAKIRQVVSPKEGLSIQLQYNNEFRWGSHSQHYLQTIVSLQKNTFYTLGLTAYPATTTTSSRIVAKENGQEVITTQEATTQKDTIGFHLQWGHRFNHWAFRLGVFENSGGLATDLHLLDNRLRFSLEAFRFSQSSPKRWLAQFKFYGFWYFLPHVYASFGLADISGRGQTENPTDTSSHNNNNNIGSSIENMSPFVGAGFHFNDADIKRLTSSAALMF